MKHSHIIPPPLCQYKVEVHTATHDDLKKGLTSTGISYISVMAHSDNEAVLIACQMAACNRREAMPTYSLLLDWKE